MTRIRLNELYAERFDFDPVRSIPPKSRIVIATIPRTGSTHLCMELWRTGVFGAPLEYVNMANRAQDMYPRIANQSPTNYWNEIIARRTSPNGIFAFKAFASDLSTLQARHIDLFREVVWDKMILLRRRDKLGQAISYARAFQTKNWFAEQRPVRAPVFDRALIDKTLGWIATSERVWLEIANHRNDNPIEIFYEDVVSDISSVISRILLRCSVDDKHHALDYLPEVQMQRDDINEMWRDMYMNGFDPII